MVLVPAVAHGQHDSVPQLQDHRPAEPASVPRPDPDRRRHHRCRDAPAVRAGRDGVQLPRVARLSAWRSRGSATAATAGSRRRGPSASRCASPVTRSGRTQGSTGTQLLGSAASWSPSSRRRARSSTLNRPAVQLDVPLRDRQAEAGAGRLRREVRLEDPFPAPPDPSRRRCRSTSTTIGRARPSAERGCGD